jgi:hypothetical protein
MSKPKRPSLLERQRTLTYAHWENLNQIVKDLRMLKELIPREAYRVCGGTEYELVAEYRKLQVLRYVRAICDDHLLSSEKLLQRGWRVPGKGERND